MYLKISHIVLMVFFFARYGNQLVIHGELTPGRVLTVYFSIIIGAMAIGQAAPSVTAFADGISIYKLH